MLDRYEWIQCPDGKYILIDTYTSKVVEGSPTYTITSTSSATVIDKVIQEVVE